MNDLNISIEELENKLRDIESQLEKKGASLSTLRICLKKIVLPSRSIFLS